MIHLKPCKSCSDSRSWITDRNIGTRCWIRTIIRETRSKEKPFSPYYCHRWSVPTILLIYSVIDILWFFSPSIIRDIQSIMTTVIDTLLTLLFLFVCNLYNVMFLNILCFINNDPTTSFILCVIRLQSPFETLFRSSRITFLRLPSSFFFVFHKVVSYSRVCICMSYSCLISFYFWPK